MTATPTPQPLVITPDRNFDLIAVRSVAADCESAPRVCFDLRHTEWVNSEAIAFMLNLHRQGTEVTIQHPPLLFRRALRILHLEAAFAPLIAGVTTQEDPS